MNLNDVADEIAAQLDTIAGLRVFGYPPPSVTPPAGIVSYPEAVAFDATYGRGMDRIADWPLMVVVGRATDRAAREGVYEYASGTGDNSVKAVIEGGTYTSLADVRVSHVEFDVVSIGAVPYIAAIFHLEIAAGGTA